MESYKPFLGVIAVCLGLTAYLIYINSTLKSKTKPHAFSWLLWTLTTAVVFTAQVLKGGGAGSWSTGFTCIVCFIIGIISLFKYDKAYSLSDILFISVALLALVPWFFTKDPTTSVVLIALCVGDLDISCISNLYEFPGSGADISPSKIFVLIVFSTLRRLSFYKLLTNPLFGDMEMIYLCIVKFYHSYTKT